jgi:hypothetical protein
MAHDVYGTLVPQPQDEPQDVGNDLIGRAAKWILEDVNRLRKCRQFEEALTAITNRLSPHAVKFGMDTGNILATFACMAVYRKRGGRKELLEKVWAMGSRKTWKALREFPARLRRIAEEIEQVNRSLFFAPAVFVNAKTLQASLIKKRFEVLPGIIRFYATGLEMHIARIPKLWAQTLPPKPKGPSQSLLLLSRSVKVCSGKWHDQEVAELLNAAAVGLGVNREFDAIQIAQTRGRSKKVKIPT